MIDKVKTDHPSHRFFSEEADEINICSEHSKLRIRLLENALHTFNDAVTETQNPAVREWIKNHPEEYDLAMSKEDLVP
jgi:hypothetical protein